MRRGGACAGLAQGDPDFSYVPRLDADGPELSLLTERYVAAWGVTVAGRLHRVGRPDESARERALRDLRTAFPAAR